MRHDAPPPLASLLHVAALTLAALTAPDAPVPDAVRGIVATALHTLARALLRALSDLRGPRVEVAVASTSCASVADALDGYARALDELAAHETGDRDAGVREAAHEARGLAHDLRGEIHAWIADDLDANDDVRVMRDHEFAEPPRAAGGVR